jgi:RNA ligase (TIGR02306 family)
MTRALASIRVVDEVGPIENADAIEVARVGGWRCVIKKGEFRAGDLAVYFEVDSILPLSDPAFAFLAGRGEVVHDGKKWSRLRTSKFRGCLSQGLLLRPDAFPSALSAEAVVEGADVTELLGVKIYEAPEGPGMSLSGTAKGNWPAFLRKTDQERIQNIPWAIKAFPGELFEVTLKIDGSSLTAYFNNGKFGVCSRNLDLQERVQDGADETQWRENPYHAATKMYGLEARMRAVGLNVAVQGEFCGEGIQCNRDKIKGTRLYIFDAFDIDQGRYLTPSERNAYLDQLDAVAGVAGVFGKVDRVPTICAPVDLTTFASVDEVLAFADGPAMNTKLREGVVFKSLNLVTGKAKGEKTQVFSFKAISNAYLIKTGT